MPTTTTRVETVLGTRREKRVLSRSDRFCIVEQGFCSVLLVLCEKDGFGSRGSVVDWRFLEGTDIVMGSTDIFLSGEGYGVREVKVSPMVVLNVLDHFTRRAKGSSRVIGTLLGRVTSDNLVEVVSSFPVPHSEDMDEVAVDIDYHKTMYDLHKRVESGEEVVGWYATGANTEKNSVLIHEFYGRECANPVHILVDAELISDKADVRYDKFQHIPFPTLFSFRFFSK